MNTAFNSALKQSTSIRKDLASLSALLVAADASSPEAAAPLPNGAVDPPSAASTAAAFGALSASLTAFARTVDEYNALARQELNASKQEKAHDRIRNFRTELGDFRAQLDRLKAAREDAVHQRSRAELLGRRGAAASENPYSSGWDGSSGGPGGGGGGGGGGGRHARTMSVAERGAGAASGAEAADAQLRESHALREHSFFASTNAALDEYLARGQAVLGDLGSQRDMLKNTQKRMYTVANTLGVSGDTIRMIERRAREDKWIFYAGIVVFVLFCWLCLHYLR